MSASNPAMEAFIAEAMSIGLLEAFAAAGGNVGKLRRIGQELVGPCPSCGGTDRFALRPASGVFNCRGSEGGKPLAMVSHIAGCDFLEACELVLGRDRPGREPETVAQREARERAARDRIAKQAREAEAKSKADNEFRERERRKARGIYSHALPLGREEGRPVYGYLLLRTGQSFGVSRWLRYVPRAVYYHGFDDQKRPLALHEGPAMVAPIIDTQAEIIGCHMTWIDLSQQPKGRPLIADPDTGEILPTKKMRGTKKGGLIPLFGDPRAARWVGGEGIENTLAIAAADPRRKESFYFAAGDLGNLSGPDEVSSRFPHPSIRKQDKRGRDRPFMIAGPVPKANSDGEAVPVADHVTELVLLGDGDSEPIATASAMARAKARHMRPDRLVSVLWPPRGKDFASMQKDFSA